jgi:hypothetical protein
MAVEVRKKKESVAFLDPECFSKSNIQYRDFFVSYTKRAYKSYAKKRVIISCYKTGENWIAMAIFPKQKTVLYLDSYRMLDTNFSELVLAIDE